MATIEEITAYKDHQIVYWNWSRPDGIFLMGDTVRLVTVVNVSPYNDSITYLMADGQERTAPSEHFFISGDELFDALCERAVHGLHRLA